MLQLKNFVKSYSKRVIVQNNELELPGGIYWLKGSNGSGKSTFMKSLAGIIPFSGDVLLDGISIKHKPEQYRRLVNFCEAEPLFPEFITGSDLFALFAEAKGAGKGQISGLIHEFGIGAWISNPVKTYSSGMLKKLAIALSFAGRPKWVLLDEPLITLDKESLSQMLQVIKRQHTENQVSFIISSHQQIESGVFDKVRNLEIKDTQILTMDEPYS